MKILYEDIFIDGNVLVIPTIIRRPMKYIPFLKHGAEVKDISINIVDRKEHITSFCIQYLSTAPKKGFTFNDLRDITCSICYDPGDRIWLHVYTFIPDDSARYYTSRMVTLVDLTYKFAQGGVCWKSRTDVQGLEELISPEWDMLLYNMEKHEHQAQLG